MLKTGIFFGGPSREREIAFAGGRTVYDNLNKSVFEPVPVFVDSLKNFILLDWSYLYKGTIRDFYPPVSHTPPSPHGFQVYVESLRGLSTEELDALMREVGRPVKASELPDLMDVAFLALHGEFGEDGQIQGLLESLSIPYTGSGIRPSAIGMDKAFQKKMMSTGGFACPEVQVIHRRDWLSGGPAAFFDLAEAGIGYPMVIRPSCQGSSIGVQILQQPGNRNAFTQAIDAAFFRTSVAAPQWSALSAEARVDWVRRLSDIRDGLGFPLLADGEVTLYHPEDLLTYLNEQLLDGADDRVVWLEAGQGEQRVIVEAFIRGKEFSCIVVRLEDGTAVALPPTEIVKGGEVFDYRSKYLPGLSRKVTPIDLPEAQIDAIRVECERLFHFFEFHTYARIDGFIQADGTIYLNDPNTTSGMLPSSFFFHQAAEIGLNPSQFLTYIIRCSIQERMTDTSRVGMYDALLQRLDELIRRERSGSKQRRRIAVLLGGYSFERHISVESGRNIFEKLSSSDKYEPIPVFLTGQAGAHRLFQLPINLLLKDNADDIRDKILGWKPHPLIERIKQACLTLTTKYASRDTVFEPLELSYDELAERVDGVFIALHGRPGEDGAVQQELEARGLPYNGSGVDSSQLTIDKYRTLQTLRQHGFSVADQLLVQGSDYAKAPEKQLGDIEARFSFPLIAKPVDDGCSSAVKLIRSREQLAAYLRLLFRAPDEDVGADRALLKLHPKEEFPIKTEALIETLIGANGASHFLEITGGLLTHHEPDGSLRYEVFEPSEALASGEVLSLEEKFLAGEGQNITPARFASNPDDYHKVAAQVKADLERAARLLGVQGYARIDAFVRIFPDLRTETIVIEVNSLPGMTPATCIYHQAAINGYKPYAFIDKILEFGFHEH
jgi:UDP-N-acetylmuramate--alanine ligase